MIAIRRLVVSPRISRTISAISSHSFSTSMIHDDVDDHHTEEWRNRMPVTSFTEDEEMVRETARMWANQELKPIVREMDDACETRPEIIQSLFDHGFMGMVSVERR